MRKTDPPLIPQPVFMLFGKQLGGKLQRWKVEICPRFLCGRAVAYTAPVHKQMWSLSAGNQPVQGPQPHTARNVLIKYSLQISHLGWCCFFSLHCFGLVNMERRREGRRERRWEVETRGAYFDSGPTRWLSVVLTDMLLSCVVVGWLRPRRIVTADVWIWMLPWVTARNALQRRQGSRQSQDCKVANQ